MNDADPVDPRRRHAANVLGLCLGAACIALTVACIIIFSNTGLPKDPKEWKRQQQQEAENAASSSTAPQKEASP